MRRAILFTTALGVASLLACDDEQHPIGPDSAPTFEIVDGAHNNGNAHFFFLPPLVPQPEYGGVFDGALAPVVEICAWDGTACAEPLTTRITVDDHASTRVRVDAGGEAYHANWHTRDSDVEPGGIYRIRVLVDGFVLGHLDLQATQGGRARQAAAFPTFQVNQTIPIRFRIEEGAVPEGPTASFVVGGALEAASATTFDASASTGDQLSYAWDFGDGKRGGGVRTAHVYTAGGTYDVTLVVTDAAQQSASTTRSVTIAPPPEPAGEATLSGRVFNSQGDRLSGISVTLVGTGVSAVSDGLGAVSLNPVPTGVSANLRLSASGFADRLVQVAIPAGATEAYFEARMIARQAAQTLATAENGGQVAGQDGATIVLPPNALVDGNGNAVTGNVDVAVTPIDVSGDEIATFPGSFTGINSDGESGLLLTYGVAEYVLTQGGEALQLALGQTATIEIPIYTGGASLGEQIPLWSLDEVTGTWIEEGVGTVVASAASPTGLALRAEVTHLSWWNIDVWVDAPYEPWVMCEEAGSPVACTVTAAVFDPSFPRTFATTSITPAGQRLTFPPNLDVTVSGLNLTGTLTGGQIVNGPIGGGAADTVRLVLTNRPVSPLHSTVEAAPDTLLVGQVSTITVRAKYDDGTDATESGATVVLFQTGDPVLRGSGTFGPVMDNLDGTYTATFTADAVGSPVEIRARLDAVFIPTPAFVAIVPLNPATGSIVSLSATTVSVSDSILVTLDAKQADGTNIGTGGASVAFRLGTSEPIPGDGEFRSVTDHGDGTYSTYFVATTVGKADVIAFVDGQGLLPPPPTVTVTSGLLDGAVAEALIAEAFLTWWQGTDGDVGHPSAALSVGADELTMSWQNFGMLQVSQEPRVAWNNSPTFTYRRFNEVPWRNMYAALSAAYAGLAALDAGTEIGGAGGPDNARARAFGKFVQGLAHGWLALMFDRAFVLEETVDLETAVIQLRPYDEVMAVALAELQEAIAVATGNTFTLPATWINGRALTNTELAQLAHSYIARFTTQVARTPAERAAVDWASVVAHVDQGIQSDFTIQGEDAFNGAWFHAIQWWGSQVDNPVWGRADYKTIGVTDTSGNYATWLATPVAARTEFLIETADQRLTATGDPQGDGADFKFMGPSQFPAARGTYHYSFYGHKRYENYYLSDGAAPMMAMKLAAQQLIKAEGLWRLGDMAGAAAIVNQTRVGRGGLPAAAAADPDLFDKLAYEKQIENFIVCAGCAFFDRRGWGPRAATGPAHHLGLVDGTPLHFPIPGSELERLGLPNYTFGGAGPAMTAAAPGAALEAKASKLFFFGEVRSGVEMLEALRALNRGRRVVPQQR